MSEHRLDTSASRVYWASTPNMTRRLAAHHCLARHHRACRVNITDLVVDLYTQENEATARADELRNQIAHLTAALTETEARLADLATTRKIITELARAGTEPDPPESSTTYQAIVNAFNQHPDRVFRARELHELLDTPTDNASVNVTRNRLGRLTRQGFLTQPGRRRYQKHNAHSHQQTATCGAYRPP